MIRNYFKVAFRNIMKYKFFSAINILGMTIGVTACLFLILYIADELSFDQFHKDAGRIYQVGLHGKIAGQDIRTANTCPPLYRAMVEEIPDVEDATRIAPNRGQVVKYEDKAFTEDKVFSADSNFFSFFSFKLLDGDPATALKEPNSVVITEAMATKYFGAENPIGKLMSIGGNNSVKVTGVAENAPTNSHFLFNMLISSVTRDDLKRTVWLNNYLYTYFKLRPQGSLTNVENQFQNMVVKYVGPEIERFMGVNIKQMEDQGGAYGYFTTALTGIHLRSTTREGDGLEPGGNITYVYSFGAIALLIIVIACINFMNLSTARSSGRAKEVGLRKTLGSLRGQMVGQFLTESTIYSLAAVAISVVACYMLMPYFNTLAGKQLGIDMLTQPVFIIGIIGLIIFVGLVAGSYPAFYLTSFNAVEVLKGKVRAGMKSKGVRRTLVVFQFAISIFLIICTAVVYQQLSFMQERDMGIDKHNVMILRNAFRLDKNMDAFKNTLDQQTGVVKASYTNNVFPGVNNTTVFKAVGSDQDHIMGMYYADYEHMDVMKFELKEGRFFSRDFPSDSTAIIINEAAVKEFGYTDPLSEEIIYNDEQPERLRVIGVIKDFNFETLKEQVRPLSVRLGGKSNQLMVRYEGAASDVITSIEALWKDHASGEPFEYQFLDENFDELFRAEQRMSSLFTVFSGLAIFVACLGLFALSAFTSEQRTKEIGIRKAMGASVTNLTVLLSREFTFLVLIAFLPAAVFSWWAMDSWLAGFAYQVTINPLVYVFSGLAAIFIAWLTVSFQSVKAARANPIHSLKYE